MNWSPKPTVRRAAQSGLALLACYCAGVFNPWQQDDATPSEPVEEKSAGSFDDLSPEEEALLDWRILHLTKAGFDELRANTLAVCGDWRRAIALVEEGCDPVVAADICL